MLLPSVSETLASVSRHPALEAAISALRRGVAHEHVAGVTDTAKALVAAHVAAELRRPVIVLVTSGARAEALAPSLEFFYKALAGQEATGVAVFPALDAFPWQEVSSHAEILETRAVTLWRYTSGLARVVVAPIAAARMRLADAASYAAQARSLARDQEVSLDEFVAHLRRVGYESHDMVEMPGQFTVRGGIVDVFPAEAERPVRVELFGDAVESLREFDPNTQRSVRPTERRRMQPQPTTRYHGNVPAFMAEARDRIASGDRVLLAAGNLGELERFVDLCHEYEVPYRLGELEENVTSARLSEDSSAGSVPAIVLVRAPFVDGVVFPDSHLTIYGTGDLFETQPTGAASRRRPKTASFFSDFSELKPGDYVVHVDHGIGQFEGLHQIENGGAPGEFMRLHYADDARLYHPLERLDLLHSYCS